MKVPVTGGPAVTIGALEKPTPPHGGVWSDDGTIYFAMHDQGLWRIPATGGRPERLPAAEATPSDPAGATPRDHRQWPSLLPDGRGLLFSKLATAEASSQLGRIFVRDLKTGAERMVIPEGSFPNYVAGYVVYVYGSALRAVRFDLVYGSALRAVRFDLDRLEPVGTPRPVLNGVVTKTEGAGELGVSRNGALVYMATAASRALANIVWRDRSGGEAAFGAGAISQAQNPRLSPDGRRLAISVAGDIWVYFVDGRPPIRLTTDGSSDGYLAPMWSPDGQRIVAERRAGARGIVSVAGDGSNPAVTTISEPAHFHPHGWLNGGRDLLAVRMDGLSDIVRWPLSNPTEISDVVRTPGDDGASGASMSPDGRWLAYVSDQTGTHEVWVRPLLEPGAPVRVSPDGGLEPVWAKSGRELYYLREMEMMAASVTISGATISFGVPAKLFDSSSVGFATQPPSYDVTADGRFVMLKAADTASAAPDHLVVVLNWAEELRRTEPQH